MQFFKDILYLFFPKICPVCSTILLQNEIVLCTKCRHQLPIIQDNQPIKNKNITFLVNKSTVTSVKSFLYYRKHGGVKRMIHQLKYKNQEEIGDFLGNWFGQSLKENGHFLDVDYIIPVPLHKYKYRKRGYNQLTLFGKALGKILNTTYQPGILIKTTANQTQAITKRLERFKNVEAKFHLSNISFFENKHILLIDDIITTGATLSACCKELSKTKNIRISIATIAFTENL